MNKVQEMQNEIYRKMTAEKKLEIVDDFYKFGQKLQSLKKNKPVASSPNNLKQDYDYSKVH